MVIRVYELALVERLRGCADVSESLECFEADPEEKMLD